MADFYQSSLFDPSAPNEQVYFRKKRNQSKCNESPSKSDKNKQTTSFKENDSTNIINVVRNIIHYFQYQLSSYQQLEEETRDAVINNDSSAENDISCGSLATGRDSFTPSTVFTIPSTSTTQCPEDIDDDQDQPPQELCQRIEGRTSKGKVRQKSLKRKLNLLMKLTSNIRKNNKDKDGTNQCMDQEILIDDQIHQSKKKSVKKRKKLQNVCTQSKKAIKMQKKKVKKSLSQGCRHMGTGVMNMTSAIPEFYEAGPVTRKYSNTNNYIYNPENKFY